MKLAKTENNPAALPELREKIDSRFQILAECNKPIITLQLRVEISLFEAHIARYETTPPNIPHEIIIRFK
jgi:hypothetical protein